MNEPDSAGSDFGDKVQTSVFGLDRNSDRAYGRVETKSNMHGGPEFTGRSAPERMAQLADDGKANMQITKVIAAAFGVSVVASISAMAQEAGFFRLVSTQQTYIVSLDSAGLLVWSNAVHGAPCQVQAKRNMDGVWTNDFPKSPVRTNGSLLQVRVPMCRVLEGWIVAFQPGVTLAQAEALLDANEIIWQPLAWNSLRMAAIQIPPGKPLSPVRDSPLVKYVDWDQMLEAF